MEFYSRYLKLNEFDFLAEQLGNQDVKTLLPVAHTLFEKGLVRGTFIDSVCYSMQGVYALNNILGDAWMVSNGPLLREHPIAPHRSARVVIKEAFESFKFDKIIIHVSDDFHVEWCKSIGFTDPKKVEGKVYLSILRKL